MEAARKILIVDDDADLREALSEHLVAVEDFDVFEAETGRDALDRARRELHDLILLDIGLPDVNGREICRLMRKQGIECPIIMLTGFGSDSDTILGLNAGANDYVTKPFNLEVLLARIRAHLRQHERSEDAVLPIGHYRFRPARKMLFDPADEAIHLTEKESNILKYLYRAGGRTVDRQTLLREVWGYNPSVSTHTLETHVYRLRRKIKQDPAKPPLLLTEPGGYRLAVRS